MTNLNLKLDRRYKCNGYTIGHMYVDGKYFCDTLEDADRGLADTMTEAEIKAKKLKSITAIPTGVYYVNMNTKSAKFGDKPFYRQTCGGKLPRLLGVKGFDGILIHCGNTAKDTDGCILVGENKVKGQLINSRETFQRLYAVLKDAANRRATITITIM
jgi:hypothetical protein